ncbi:MAG: amidohydrolase family protein [Gallionella sp.]
MTSRRKFITACCSLPLIAFLPKLASAENGVEFSNLRGGFSQRLKTILAAGELPYIDIESSCKSDELDIDYIAKNMDRLHIGLMALSADIKNDSVEDGKHFDSLSERLVASFPDRFIPVGNGGQPPTLEFLEGQEAAAQAKRIMLFGEDEFRHYPSPRQVKRHNMGRDVSVPIDGPVGHRAFSMSEQTGLPFQIHYEIEDVLLDPLENMLQQYPKAKVIWCHLAQIRYIEGASRYNSVYVESLIKRFPYLYFDTAFGDSNSIYPLSNQRHARVWNEGGNLKVEWRDLIVEYPKRFLSALDLGGDRLNKIVEYDQKHRKFLRFLPSETQHQVAYRNAWSLLFGEEFH